jgi:hypothetical protein
MMHCQEMIMGLVRSASLIALDCCGVSNSSSFISTWCIIFFMKYICKSNFKFFSHFYFSTT